MDPLLAAEELVWLPLPLLLIPDRLDSEEKDDDCEFVVLELPRLLELPESPELDADPLDRESTELPDDDAKDDDADDDNIEDANDDDDVSDDEAVALLTLEEPVDDIALVEDELKELDTVDELMTEADEEPATLDAADDVSDT